MISIVRRLFDQYQRNLLYVLARGKCSICGCLLNPADWHADHVIPFSKGGVTHLSNGQALCPPCNLSKGSTPLPTMQPVDYVPGGSSLHTWQMEFIDRFIPFAKAQITRPVRRGRGVCPQRLPRRWQDLGTTALNGLPAEGRVC